MRIRTDLRSLIKGYSRMAFYAGNFSRYFMPSFISNSSFNRQLKELSPDELAAMEELAAYYCRLNPGAVVDPHKSVPIGDFHYPWGEKHKFTTYFFDLFACVRCFPKNCRFEYLPGDVDFVLPSPAFAKARPISEGNSNTVLLPLNKVRHMRFVNDRRTFSEKKDKLVFRNVVRKQPWRTLFLEKTIDNPICDSGQINHDADDPRFIKAYMPMEQMLDYKFIACIEGHDVATNLKWVMSSNSIAVMPRPRIESWFREGTLVGGKHYIEIKPDYSDLDEKLHYYLDNPDKAQAIIDNAHKYVEPFRDSRRQLTIARLTARRYFMQTGQLKLQNI